MAQGAELANLTLDLGFFAVITVVVKDDLVIALAIPHTAFTLSLSIHTFLLPQSPTLPLF